MKMRHVTVHTENFEREIEFYERYAGLTVRRDMRASGRNMIFLSDKEGDTEIEIIETEGAKDSGNDNLSVGFEAEDLEALRRKLEEDGFEPSPFVSPNPSVRFFFVKDPAGVRVQFII